MFSETTIFYVKIWNHQIETTTLKRMFQVPGSEKNLISYKISHHRIIPNFSRHLLPCHRSTCFCNFSFSASKRWHLEPKLESPKLEKLHALLVEDFLLRNYKAKANHIPARVFLILAACMFAESSQGLALLTIEGKSFRRILLHLAARSSCSGSSASPKSGEVVEIIFAHLVFLGGA